MNSRNAVILAAVLVLFCVVGVTRSTIRLNSANGLVTAQERALRDTAGLASEIYELRDREQRVERQSRPEQDVIARVNAVLSANSIPHDRFSSLAPESDVAVQSKSSTSATEQRLRRQTVRLSLRNLELTELGQLLVTWRNMNPMWTSSRIDLNHKSGRNASGNRYDVTILLSALYLAEEEPPA